MHKQKKLLRNDDGFTLIEIISVLVVLGILAAVAVPRYIDLQEDARLKAATGGIAEIKARLNLSYGKYLLQNNATPADVNDLYSFADLASDANTIGDFIISLTDGATDTVTMTVVSIDGVTVSSAATDTWDLPTTN